jgi:hypothetical protein
MTKDLGIAARAVVDALEKLNKALANYTSAAVAVGAEAPDGATARGLDYKQVRRRLEAEVIGRLCPKPRVGEPRPILELDGAPEARRFIAANPLPGLS